MGGVGVSAFSAKEVITVVLPTIIAFMLYAPFFIHPPANTLEIDKAVGIAVLSSFVFSPVVYFLASKTQKLLPLKSLNLQREKPLQEWMQENWDYDNLWDNLDKDEKDTLFLLRGSYQFYQTTGFYFLIYSVILLIFLLYSIFQSFSQASIIKFVQSLWAARIPMVGNVMIPVIIVLPLSLIITYFLYEESVSTFCNLFHHKGEFPLCAGKYQKKVGGIAKSIWGRVYCIEKDNKEKGIDDAVIRFTILGPLENMEKTLSVEQFKDYQGGGYFRVKGACQKYENCRCKITIQCNGFQLEKTFKVNRNEIPYVEFDISGYQKT